MSVGGMTRAVWARLELNLAGSPRKTKMEGQTCQLPPRVTGNTDSEENPPCPWSKISPTQWQREHLQRLGSSGWPGWGNAGSTLSLAAP